MATSAFDVEQPTLSVASESEYMTSESSNEGDVQPIGRTNWLNLAAYILNTAVTYTSLTGIFGATNTELSNKYQTLVTPAGWAFSIWGPIFIWECIFVVSQFLPRFRNSEVVAKMSPWWWALCIFQVLWTFAFAQDQVTMALILMMSILVSLLGVSWSTDRLQLSTAEYWLLRAPLSLQLGWILVAGTLSISVQADAVQSSQELLLALAIVSNAALVAIVAIFTFGVRTPDPLVGVVAAWAFLAIYAELGSPTKLNDPSRFNPSQWNSVTLGGLRAAAAINSVVAATLAVVATLLKLFGAACSAKLPNE